MRDVDRQPGNSIRLLPEAGPRPSLLHQESAGHDEATRLPGVELYLRPSREREQLPTPRIRMDAVRGEAPWQDGLSGEPGRLPQSTSLRGSYDQGEACEHRSSGSHNGMGVTVRDHEYLLLRVHTHLVHTRYVVTARRKHTTRPPGAVDTRRMTSVRFDPREPSCLASA